MEYSFHTLRHLQRTKNSPTSSTSSTANTQLSNLKAISKFSNASKQIDLRSNSHLWFDSSTSSFSWSTGIENHSQSEEIERRQLKVQQHRNL
jgi:hypothetical protein